MKAIIITDKGQVALKDAPRPENAVNGHIIIQMQAMGINAGDRFFISGGFPPGFFPVSQYDIAGVSGVGKVTANFRLNRSAKRYRIHQKMAKRLY